ncbi:MAG: hypothetical protein PHW60_14220 [Kiritimatiellae bacterium]|nr:hypothetical protein [Kiritimatiellia bacterium]
MTDNGSTHDPADTPPSNDEIKNRTLRISLDSVRPLKSPSEEKKSTGLVPGIPMHAGPIPQTIRLKRPPTSPISVQPIDSPPTAKKHGDTAFVQVPAAARAATAETVKRQTSRIGMAESAPPKSPTDFKRSTGPILGIPVHAGPIPQTIRLKRPPTSSVMRPPTAQVQPVKPAMMPPVAQARQDITEAPTIVKNPSTYKSSTSRIVLEESPAPAAAATKHSTSIIPPIVPAEPPAPKTIRLKRPSTLSDAEETVQAATEKASPQTSRKGETSKIDLPAEDNALTPMTQRKTIKIKRTDRTTIMPRSAIQEAAAQPESGSRVEAPAPQEEDVIVFPLVALAATLCIAALVYIMVVQAFGVHLLLPSSMQLH